MTKPSLVDVARIFLRLGMTAFGGPVAHVAMMHRDVVEQKRWIDDQGFIDRLGITSVIPGPNSTEMAMLLGGSVASARGLVVAGLCFIVPAVVIVLGLAWAYVRYGETPAVQWLLYGVKPVIIAIVVHALIAFARRALTRPLLVAVAGGALLAYVSGVNEVVVIAAGGALALVAYHAPATAVVAFVPAVAVAPLEHAASRAPVELDRLLWIFLKTGALLYGSGYVLLAFLRSDLVAATGWLTNDQLLDAVSIGQVTPGPVLSTATFAGYVVAGWPGAAVATVGIFLPSFILASAASPLVARVRASPATSAVLDGVNAAVVGLIAGVAWELGHDAIVDAPTAVLAIAAAVVVWRFSVNSAWVVVAGAAAGLAVSLFS